MATLPDDLRSQANGLGQYTPRTEAEMILDAVRDGAVSGAVISDATSRAITVNDNGMSLRPTGTLTYTIPAGLSPMPSFTVDCPASGTVSIARSGGTTLNGAGTTLTRTRASNPVGFVVLAHADTDAYGVSGA